MICGQQRSRSRLCKLVGPVKLIVLHFWRRQIGVSKLAHEKMFPLTWFHILTSPISENNSNVRFHISWEDQIALVDYNCNQSKLQLIKWAPIKMIDWFYGISFSMKSIYLTLSLVKLYYTAEPFTWSDQTIWFVSFGTKNIRFWDNFDQFTIYQLARETAGVNFLRSICRPLRTDLDLKFDSLTVKLCIVSFHHH